MFWKLDLQFAREKLFYLQVNDLVILFYPLNFLIILFVILCLSLLCQQNMITTGDMASIKISFKS